MPARRPASPPGETPLDLDGILARVRQSLPSVAEDAQKTPAALLAELLALSPRRRATALADRPAFRRPKFLAYLRETAVSALPRQPDLAESLAFLAVLQAEESLPVEEARRHLLAAHCLIATVRRLRRLSEEADLLLDRATFLVTCDEDRHLYLRTLAVLRWEQGRTDEAQSLLAGVLRLHRKPTHETARSQLLLGLLHLLEGTALANPLPLLRSACLSFDLAYHTLEALLARLGLALALGQAGDLAAAADYRHQAQDIFVLLSEEPSVLAYPAWLDARVAMLTDPEEALEGLRAARGDLLRHEFPFAATLATVDTALLLAHTGRADQIPRHLAESPLPLQLPPADRLCADLARLPAGTLRGTSRVLAHREVAAPPAPMGVRATFVGVPAADRSRGGESSSACRLR